MTFDWFKIFNKTEFEATGLVSRTYTQVLEGYGLKDILVTKGITLGVLFDEVFLSVELNEKNPFSFENRAVYVDQNDDVWVGVKLES